MNFESFSADRPLQLSLAQCASLACVLEATASKPGNVHRGADFDDLTFSDLLVAAVAIAPIIERAARIGVGGAVLRSIQATRQLVQTNANLGIVLLLAPLAAVPPEQKLSQGVSQVLSSLTAKDAQQVYEAIRLAQPGGMGKVEQMDVAKRAPENLLAAMRAAAPYDLVARQYVNDFQQVLDDALPIILRGCENGWTLSESVIYAHLSLMSRLPDTLIARKCGAQVAQRCADMAAAALDAGTPRDEAFWRCAADLDFWLRSDGHRRNPGATADLIAAALFAGLRDGELKPPWQ